jgi:proteic killer suppression protein
VTPNRGNEIGDTQLEVLYEDSKLEKLCTDEREMRRKRSDIAGKLRLRIKALEAVTTVGELRTHDPLGNWHPLTANLDGLWAGKLSPNYRLLVRPEGAEDASSAVTVTVIEISNHYGH